MNIADMVENLNAAILTCDADFNTTYANAKCKLMFKALLNMENFVGRPMAECHKPETMVKLRNLFQEYKEHKRKLDYYIMDIPDGKLTIVNVPIYKDEALAGVMELIFEGSLA
jgi:transcriptional regulator with PAS, ATPase and Fis domain